MAAPAGCRLCELQAPFTGSGRFGQCPPCVYSFHSVPIPPSPPPQITPAPTSLNIPLSPPATPPSLPCVSGQAKPVCAGPSEPCFYDATCSTPQDAFGGLGCNAGGYEKCRFCGFGSFDPINCPGDPVMFTEAELTTEDAAGGGMMMAIVAAAAGLIVCCFMMLYCRQRARQRALADDAKPTQSADTREACAAQQNRNSMALVHPDAHVETVLASPFAPKRRKPLLVQEPTGNSSDDQEKHHRTVLADQDFVFSWDDVELRSMISMGSIGRMYRVSMRDTGLQCVMRRLNMDTLSRYSERALTKQMGKLVKLNHPNLLLMYGLATDSMSNFGIVVEEAHTSLEKLLLRAISRKSIADGVRSMWKQIGGDTANGLAHLHDHHVAHLALHPRNVLLDKNMHVKLTDYGRPRKLVAHRLEIGTGAAEESQDDACNRTVWTERGEDTRLCVAPELLQGDDHAGASSCDVWALGCLLARLVTQRPLFAPYADASMNRLTADPHSISLQDVKMCVGKTLLRVATREANPALDALVDGDSRGRTVHSAPRHLIKACVSIDKSARPSCKAIHEELKRMTQHAAQRSHRNAGSSNEHAGEAASLDTASRKTGPERRETDHAGSTTTRRGALAQAALLQRTTDVGSASFHHGDVETRTTLEATALPAPVRRSRNSCFVPAATRMPAPATDTVATSRAGVPTEMSAALPQEPQAEGEARLSADGTRKSKRLSDNDSGEGVTQFRPPPADSTSARATSERPERASRGSAVEEELDDEARDLVAQHLAANVVSEDLKSLAAPRRLQRLDAPGLGHVMMPFTTPSATLEEGSAFPGAKSSRHRKTGADGSHSHRGAHSKAIVLDTPQQLTRQRTGAVTFAEGAPSLRHKLSCQHTATVGSDGGGSSASHGAAGSHGEVTEEQIRSHRVKI